MTIVVLAFMVLILISSKKTKNNRNYMSIDYTNTVKGIFLFFVFLRHFLQYKPNLDNVSKNFFGVEIGIDNFAVFLDSHGGQLLVTMFLFYSGYGVMESVKKKGTAYIDSIPKKRMLKTLVNFDIAVIVYLICDIVFSLRTLDIKTVLLSFVCWESIGNSNWYIFCIIVMYFFTYISLKAFDNKNKAVLSIAVGTLLYVAFMSLFKSPYWYNTAFCYVLGCFFSVNREKIEIWLKKKELLTFTYAFLVFMVGYHLNSNIWWYYIHTVAFAAIIVILSRKITLNNKALRWLGENLFPLYIFQRLPMRLLGRVSFMHNNPWLYFIAAFASTVIIAVVYNFVMSVPNKFCKKSKV